jgi:hypothetical protein
MTNKFLPMQKVHNVLRYTIPVIFALGLVGISHSNSIAQDETINPENLKDIASLNVGSGIVITRSKTETIGSPYFNEGFLEGDIQINKSTKSGTLLLRYNMYNNSVEFLRDGELLATNPNQIDGFRFYAKDKDVLFRKGFKTDIKSVEASTFLRIAYDGNVKLLIKHSASLNKDVPSYGRSTKQQKYSTFLNHYVVTSGGNFHKIESPKADVLKIFSDKKNALKNYAEQNNLNFKNEADLVNVLKYYDTLK